MNLRWLRKADGTKVLQIEVYDPFKQRFEDIPAVDEPRQARECWILNDSKNTPIIAIGRRPDNLAEDWIKFREVLND